MGPTFRTRTSPSCTKYRTRSPSANDKASRTTLGNMVCPLAVMVDSIMHTNQFPYTVDVGIVAKNRNERQTGPRQFGPSPMLQWPHHTLKER